MFSSSDGRHVSGCCCVRQRSGQFAGAARHLSVCFSGVISQLSWINFTAADIFKHSHRRPGSYLRPCVIPCNVILCFAIATYNRILISGLTSHFRSVTCSITCCMYPSRMTSYLCCTRLRHQAEVIICSCLFVDCCILLTFYHHRLIYAGKVCRIKLIFL